MPYILSDSEALLLLQYLREDPYPHPNVIALRSRLELFAQQLELGASDQRALLGAILEVRIIPPVFSLCGTPILTNFVAEYAH